MVCLRREIESSTFILSRVSEQDRRFPFIDPASTLILYHRLAQDAMRSRLKTLLISILIPEKMLRFEEARAVHCISQLFFLTLNDSNPACDTVLPLGTRIIVSQHLLLISS
eukprot:COSAG02_NODE_1870_length_10588_cov_78.982652_2_plen_111_part_00